MEVVLLERIEKLGQMGEIVSVKNGYARNFLLPQGKALRATGENMKRFEEQRAELEARNLERKAEADKVAGRMTDVSIVLVRQAGENGQLYGSVSARDIADGLSAAGYKVERTQVVLDRPIKELGLHGIRVSLHPEVSVTVSVNVARSEAEAEQQAAGADADTDQLENFFESSELAAEAADAVSETASDESASAADSGAEDETVQS
jgi:large subunit ribosomal protein L9